MIRQLVGHEAPPRGFDVDGMGRMVAGRRSAFEKVALQERFDATGRRSLVWNERGAVIAVLVWDR